jgi:hypothetical protein
MAKKAPAEKVESRAWARHYRAATGTKSQVAVRALAKAPGVTVKEARAKIRASGKVYRKAAMGTYDPSKLPSKTKAKR